MKVLAKRNVKNINIFTKKEFIYFISIIRV